MQHSYCAIFDNISIRPMHRCDIENIRLWRNDSQLNRFLNPMAEITADAQVLWYEKYLKDEDLLLFAVIDNENNKLIGTVGISGFEDGDGGKTAEIGHIIIGDDTERGKGIGYKALLLAACVGFKELKLARYRLRVFEENIIALNLYRKAGFQKIGSHFFHGTGRLELDMEVSREEFETGNKIMNGITLYLETEEDAKIYEGG